MLSNSQQNLKRLQSLKFFQFLNQISPQLLQNCLNSDIYNRIYHTLVESDATVIVNQQQLTSQVFCQLFSKCYEGCISSYADIAHYYCEINDIMMEKYCRENKMWEVNKHCFFSVYSQDAIEDYSLQLKQQFKIVLLQSEYANMIAYINHVLMSIYLPTKENLSIFEQFCAQLSQYNIYQKVCRAIKQNICFEESYKFLIFLIDGFYYFPSLKQLIYKQQKNDNNLGDIFNIALAKLIEGGLDSLPKVQIISFLNVMVRHRIECAEKLVQILELNDNLKVVLAQGQKFGDVNIPHLQQLSELLLFLVKRNPKKPVKLYLTSQKVSQVQTFAIVMLKRGRSEFYQSSILLINEIIKYNIVGDDDQDVRIVLKALETDNYLLRKAALLVLESGFAIGKEDIVEVFLVKREKYFNMLHEFLREPFGEGCQSTHFLCLQIIHLLVTSNFSNNFIIEQCMNEILICLAAPLNLSNLSHNFISQIIKKVCFRSYKNERKNKYQNYINFTTLLKIMLSSLYMPDDFTKIMQISSNNFPNKIIITNLIQSLSYLFQRSNVLKLVEYNMIAPSLLQEIDHVLTILLEVIIKISVDGKLMQYFKGQITQQSQKKANILTILFNTLQNICYLFKNANLIFKQRIFKHRQLLLSQLYKLMPVKQLQSNKIPIVIKYTFSFAIEERIYQLDRFLPIAAPFNDYKSYCLSLIQDKIRRFNHRQLFLGIIFRDVTHGNAEIKDQIGYKRMILRYLENRNTEFNAAIEIIKDHNAPISPTRPNHFIPSHTYSSPISSFRGTVNTMNNSSLRFQGPLRSRSPSPFRPTQSRVIPGPYMCELCNRNPTSPHERTCSICNRR